MDDLDPSGLKKTGQGHEVPVGRNQYRDIVILDPGKADDVCRHADIYAFSSVPRMSAPQAAHFSAAAWQRGHTGGERFFWRRAIQTLTPGNVSNVRVAHR